MENKIKPVRCFISYSWDNTEHKNWIKDLALKLRGDGIDAILDQWHAVPGDLLPLFMEREIRESDFVLIICTPKYKTKADERTGGVGYEGDIITSEIFTKREIKKFIPILRTGSWIESAPTYLLGKYYVDLSQCGNFDIQYRNLLSTLLGARETAPPLGNVGEFGDRNSLNFVENNVTVKIKRKRQFGGSDGTFYVYFDKVEIGALVNTGDSTIIRSTPGRHSLQVQCRFLAYTDSRAHSWPERTKASNIMSLDFQADQLYEYECGFHGLIFSDLVIKTVN